MGKQLELAVLEYLDREPAWFLQDVLRSPELNTSSELLGEAISALEQEGRVLIRPQNVGDPHLEGADLRMLALVQREDGRDGIASAVEAIDRVWNAWLAGYLADHRCT